MRSDEQKRAAVRARYAQAATGTASDPGLPVVQPGCCGSSATTPGSSCCGGSSSNVELGRLIGYSAADLTAVPDGANLGLGCGNPQAIAGLKPGETVLDLGSGAGFDCFLAARQVGPEGHVIGVDMTPEMLSRAIRNAHAGGYTNVEFRLGEIEHLPVEDQSVDVIISNCVVNLSPEKPRVFAEAFRVLKPGGRLAISDMATSTELPPDVQQDVALYTGCIAGAATIDQLAAMLLEAGFDQIHIKPRDGRELLRAWGAGTRLEDVIFPATIEAVRPR